MTRTICLFLLGLAATVAPGGTLYGAPSEEGPAGGAPRPSDAPVGMVLIPAGEFLMGSDEGEEPTSESPAHTVKLESFWIDRYEVTNRRYGKFIEAGGYEKEKYWSEEGWSWLAKAGRKLPAGWEIRKLELGDDFPAHPVVGVSWFEAEAFARFEGKRLPTEAEWERAARGTDGRAYPWGNDLARGMPEPDDDPVGTRPVGSNPGDVSPVGLFDMGGGVSEWTGSWFEAYPETKFESRYWGPDARKRLRVARGGSWFEIARGDAAAAKKCRTTYRLIRYDPTSNRNFLGFRLAKDA
jgi:formylglycine-generating enzyme required for sulfatase activity